MRWLFILFLFLLLPATARRYDGFCFSATYPDAVQVERGKSTQFEIVLFNTGPFDVIERLDMEIRGQCSDADYPCTYKFTNPGQFTWNRTINVEIEMPLALYEDPVKNQLYDETGRYIGLRREQVFFNSSQCEERFIMFVMPLYGEELSATIDPSEEIEAFMDDLLIYTISLHNEGPEPFNVTFSQSGISHRRTEFVPEKLTLEPGQRANAFLNIDTTGMELGSHRSRIFVKTGALEDISLLARFEIKAAGALAQRQFELYNALREIEAEFEIKISKDTYEVEDITQIRRRLSETRDLITTGYLGVAAEEIAPLQRSVDAMEPVYIEPEREDIVIIEEPPDEERFRETAFDAETFELFMRRYAWLIFGILLFFGGAISIVTYKGFFVKNISMIKDVKYVSDLEVKVIIKIANKSMRAVKDVVLVDKSPAGFTLQSRFTSMGRNIPFTKEAEPDGITYKLDLSEIDANSKITIEYVMRKPQMIYGKIKIPPATLRFTFRGSPQTHNSNTPMLGI